MGDRVFVVVPVLNEKPNVSRLLEGLRDTSRSIGRELNVVLVDDGSTDGTCEAARGDAQGLSLVVLRHETNQGPGKAFGTAFEYLAPLLLDSDWVVTMEGDNTSRHELLAQMFLRSREGYQVVLASPYSYGGGFTETTPLRVFLSHVANVFVKEALGIHGIQTMSSFYRLYSGAVIRQLQGLYGLRIIERRGFESMIELLLKLMYAGVSISEVPMVLDSSRRVGKSKMKILRTILGYLTLWQDKGRWKRVSRKSVSSVPLLTEKLSW